MSGIDNTLKSALVHTRNVISKKFKKLHKERIGREKELSEKYSPITTSIHKMFDVKRRGENNEEFEQIPQMAVDEDIEMNDLDRNAINMSYVPPVRVQRPDIGMRYNELHDNEGVDPPRNARGAKRQQIDVAENVENKRMRGKQQIKKRAKNSTYRRILRRNPELNAPTPHPIERVNENAIETLSEIPLPDSDVDLSDVIDITDDDNDDDISVENNAILSMRATKRNKNDATAEIESKKKRGAPKLRSKRTTRTTIVGNNSRNRPQLHIFNNPTTQSEAEIVEEPRRRKRDKPKKMDRLVVISPEDYVDKSKHVWYAPKRRKVLIPAARVGAVRRKSIRAPPTIPARRTSTRLASMNRVTYGQGLEKDFIPYSQNIVYEYFDDPNELCERLKLLISSKEAGNSNHDQEINSILEELRELNIIK